MPSAAAPQQPDAETTALPRATGRIPLWRRRLWLSGAALATVVVGLTIHRSVPGSVGDFLADAAYAVLIYLLIAALAPRLGCGTVFVVSTAFCFAIEFAQLSDIPLKWAEAIPAAALVFGTTFAGRDLAAYLLGGLLLAVIDVVVRRAGHSPRVP